ncbi:MAG: hypothetical protein IJQ48_02245 [Prevotella sp.]|nr:hypothetical protein [Prevotella sp.]
MKIKSFPSVLTLIVAAVLAWLAYDIAYDSESSLDVFVAIGTALSVIITLGGAMACQLNNQKVTINFKVWSSMMFVIMLITNFCFAEFGVKMPWYPVVITCLLIVYLGFARTIAGISKV